MKSLHDRKQITKINSTFAKTIKDRFLVSAVDFILKGGFL
jgi:hypothetical protein